MADFMKNKEKYCPKELSIDELEKVSGGTNSYTFAELDAEGKATFINRHVEIHYLTTVYRANVSHGGTIVDALCTTGRGNYEVVVKVAFDDWSEGNGWFWWETIWDNKVFPYEEYAKGAGSPNELGSNYVCPPGFNEL